MISTRLLRALAGALAVGLVAAPDALAGEKGSISASYTDDCYSEIVIETGDHTIELDGDCDKAEIVVNGKPYKTLRIDDDWSEFAVEHRGEVIARFWRDQDQPARIAAVIGDDNSFRFWDGQATIGDDVRAEVIDRLYGLGTTADAQGFTGAWVWDNNNDNEPKVMIGVTLEPIAGMTPGNPNEFDVEIDPDKVTLITGVFDDGPAAKAGIVEGDLIVRVNGFDEASPMKIQEALRSKSPGDPFKVVALRDGKEQTITIELEEYDRGLFATTTTIEGEAPPAPAFPLLRRDNQALEELSKEIAEISEEISLRSLELAEASRMDRAELSKQLAVLLEKQNEARRRLAKGLGARPLAPLAQSPGGLKMLRDRSGRNDFIIVPQPTPAPAPTGLPGADVDRLEREVDERLDAMDDRLSRMEELLEKLVRQRGG